MINREQRQHLTERLYAARRKALSETTKTKPPAEVQKAMKLVAAWEERERKRQEEREQRMEAAYTSVKEALAFHEADAALKAVKAFEATRF